MITITERIREYLDFNFDGSLMMKVNGQFYHYANNEELLPWLVELFEKWARENEDENCNDPIYLFDYCLENNNFGDICTLYYEDYNGDFIKEIPESFF